ncbi:MAG TPA: phenylacetate--CoA ligase family protein [Verrucomicrobiae bacterium]|nr:phenylacetate--CoA ligase family protein [Verrucomicrobiae bacterium]
MKLVGARQLHELSAPPVERMGRDELARVQLTKLRRALGPVLKTNPFYRRKLTGAGVRRAEDVRTLEDLGRLPFTTKQELSADQSAHPPHGTNLTFPQHNYTRAFQTSGTTGTPLFWLETRESWEWQTRCWATVYRAAGVTASDRIFFAFSFGPFVGFWSAHDSAQAMGAMVLPGGGMSSHQRAKAILTHGATVLVCTPTYALHLGEVARREGLDMAASGVRITIHAGEPGASLPATKRRIEATWGARCYDHAGATEVGAWGFECAAQDGMHINEGEFIFEIIDPETCAPANEGELVITNLGRAGMPVIRYRTGDRARLDTTACSCGRTFRRLAGGILGRVDDAFVLRGVNVFPSAIENIVRQHPEAGEYAVEIHRCGELDEMRIRVEASPTVDGPTVAAGVARDLLDGLGLRVSVEAAPPGSLPRFEMKARRITDHRKREPASARPTSP